MGDHGDPAEGGEAEPLDALFRPLDRQRIRQIRKWFEGTRVDAPTTAELHEFEAWVSGEIEFALSRHQPTRDLLGLLNAARAQIADRVEAKDS
jgi:hypothetical protein